jgi:hypothetical protein
MVFAAGDNSINVYTLDPNDAPLAQMKPIAQLEDLDPCDGLASLYARLRGCGCRKRVSRNARH